MSNTSSGKHRVFVYGTLMQGERNHNLLSQSGKYKFLKSLKTLGSNFLMNVGCSVSSPGKKTPAVFMRVASGHFIQGELYEVDDDVLAALDELEQVGKNYDRVKVRLSDNSMAFMYVKRGNRQGIFNSPHLKHYKQTRTSFWNELRR